VSAGPYAIGSDHYPGLSKLVEELGEAGERLAEALLARQIGRTEQVLGKLLGLGHDGDHWDGSNIRERLQEELADLAAASAFYICANGLDAGAITKRAQEKAALFAKWHAENSDRGPTDARIDA
jgi:hypothetical protein